VSVRTPFSTVMTRPLHHSALAHRPSPTSITLRRSLLQVGAMLVTGCERGNADGQVRGYGFHLSW
jgi:hypothetical protein